MPTIEQASGIKRMLSGSRRSLAIATLSLAAVGGLASSAVSAADAEQAGDHLEQLKQGEQNPTELRLLPQPYSKGVRIVGQTTGAGGMLTFSGHCAYAGGRAGINILDVSDAHAPKMVGTLTEKGAIAAIETVHAAAGILASSVYGVAGPKFSGPGQDGNGDDAWLAVYDVSNCASPKLIVEYKWPERVHTVRVSPNGKRIYGTVISPWTGEGGIQVLDISDRAHPRFLGKLPITRPDGTSYQFATHEIALSPDEKRIYAGVIASRAGDLSPGLPDGTPSGPRLGPDAGGIYVIDNSDIAAGRPEPKLRLLGTSHHGGWHSAIPVSIGGHPYLVGSGEGMACPGAWPHISDLRDEKHPKVIGEFRLQMNMPENCPPREGVELQLDGIQGRPGTASSHFNDVDSLTDTRLGLFGLGPAGLRIADLRDPTKPVEVAYFKPGPTCNTHVRYIPETGYIWLGCGANFYVLELRPELREALHLAKVVPGTVRVPG